MPSQETRLSIVGMMCAGCVSAVEKAIKEVPGVESVLVNLGERTALVSGAVPSDLLVQAIRKAGYDAAELRSLADERDKETEELSRYHELLKRALIAGSAGLLLFITAMSGLLPDLADGPTSWILIAIITLAVMVWAGRDYYIGAWKTLKAGRGNMDTLVAMGTGTAWLYSTAVVLFPEQIPSLARHAYFEASIIIVALVSLGSALEMRARGKTSAAVKRLVGLQPTTARIIRNGNEMDVPIEDVGLDETIRIRPGDRIPVDGVVFEGSSHVDESMLTGEPMAVHKAREDQVFSGTLNTSGSFLMRSTRIGRDTALAGIIDMVRRAQASKPAIARLVDQVAAVFVPIVILIAMIAFVVWYLLGPEPAFSYAIVTATTVLLIACPCALGLATPISIMVGVGRAADKNILIRNGEALQQASRLTTVILDKTGTVTEGRPSVTSLLPMPDWDEQSLLQLAADLEAGSEHPLATAIAASAREQGLEPGAVEQFQALSGHGVTGVRDGQQLHIGNLALMRIQGIAIDQLKSQADVLANQGQTPIYIAVEKQLAGLISISDPIKQDSKDAIARLHALGIRVVMLTGDSEAAARAVAQQVGIDQVFSEVLPEDKADKVASLQQAGHIVGMVGDGINDAPALARADVGIAIGSGTDVAIESADVVLIGGSLHGVADTVALSRATLRNIRQNLFGAFIYNSLGIPVAAGLLYPQFGLLLNPVVAAAAMSMSSVTVVSNALRLKRIKL